MKIQRLSETALLMIHSDIRAAHRAYRDAIAGGKTAPHGAQEHADFRELNNEVEIELERRGVKFTHLEWSDDESL